jgi:hypothetical protein
MRLSGSREAGAFQNDDKDDNDDQAYDPPHDDRRRILRMIPPYDERSMKSSLILFHPRVRRGLPVALAALLTACAAGCASPGQPHPPSLNLPEPVKDLTAERVGDVVRLHWTTPRTTTERIDIKGPMAAEICRITMTAPVPKTPACALVTRQVVQSGPTQAEEALPPVLTVDPPALLAYRVQIFNSHGRSAGLSPEAFAAAGAAPPPVDQLRATPTHDGAMLEWQQTNSPAAVELDRLPVGPDGVVVEPAPRKPESKSSSRSTIKKPADRPQRPAPASSPKPLKMTASAPAEVKLRTPIQPTDVRGTDVRGTDAGGTDAGGTIDHTVEKGATYRYTAQRVRSVSLGGHALEIRGIVSQPVTVVMRDIFPPQPPSGLEAVPGGATASDRSIDLSWTPSADADLAGYNVYRQDIDSKGAAAGTAARLNVTPVVGPAYRDQTAVAGRRYAYRVTAVDTAGNESAPSADVQEILREQ